MGRHRVHPVVLTGPAAAAAFQLDGFRNLVWPHRYTTHSAAKRLPDAIRTDLWEEPVRIGEQPVAGVNVVLNQLGRFDADLRRAGGLSPLERVEMAVEHARRSGHVVTTGRGNADPGLAMIREIRTRSGEEPPTESYAETRQWQLLLDWGVTPWRQLEIYVGGRRYRVDFVIGAHRRRLQDRPEHLRPSHGLIVEVQGRGYHEQQFEADHERFAALTRAGFHFIAITALQLERRPTTVKATIDAALRRAGMTPLPGGRITNKSTTRPTERSKRTS